MPNSSSRPAKLWDWPIWDHSGQIYYSLVVAWLGARFAFPAMEVFLIAGALILAGFLAIRSWRQSGRGQGH